MGDKNSGAAAIIGDRAWVDLDELAKREPAAGGLLKQIAIAIFPYETAEDGSMAGAVERLVAEVTRLRGERARAVGSTNGDTLPTLAEDIAAALFTTPRQAVRRAKEWGDELHELRGRVGQLMAVLRRLARECDRAFDVEVPANAKRINEIAEMVRRTIAAQSVAAKSLEDSRVLSLQMAKWIVSHKPTAPDHACARCIPDGDVVVPGFVCGYHIATSLVDGCEAALEAQKVEG